MVRLKTTFELVIVDVTPDTFYDLEKLQVLEDSDYLGYSPELLSDYEKYVICLAYYSRNGFYVRYSHYLDNWGLPEIGRDFLIYLDKSTHPIKPILPKESCFIFEDKGNAYVSYGSNTEGYPNYLNRYTFDKWLRFNWRIHISEIVSELEKIPINKNKPSLQRYGCLYDLCKKLDLDYITHYDNSLKTMKKYLNDTENKITFLRTLQESDYYEEYVRLKHTQVLIDYTNLNYYSCDSVSVLCYTEYLDGLVLQSGFSVDDSSTLETILSTILDNFENSQTIVRIFVVIVDTTFGGNLNGADFIKKIIFSVELTVLNAIIRTLSNTIPEYIKILKKVKVSVDV